VSRDNQGVVCVLAYMPNDWFLLLTRGDADELAQRPTAAAIREARLRVYHRQQGVLSEELPFGSYRLANGYLQDPPTEVDLDEVVAEVEALLA
jgi:hypothetical protein